MRFGGIVSLGPPEGVIGLAHLVEISSKMIIRARETMYFFIY